MKADHIEPMENFVTLKDFTPPHMVQIPLEEYRRYIESTIKGQTVEISLEEYKFIREENRELQDRLRCAENRIKELIGELDQQQYRQEEIDEHTDVVTRMVADEITEKVMRDLLQLSEEQKKEVREKWKCDRFGHRNTGKIQEREVLENGRI